MNNDINMDNVNDNFNLNGNGGSKREVNSTPTLTKLEAISKLKDCNYRTYPKEIASYLKIIFGGYGTYDKHLMYIAQTYNPRTINRVINSINKQFRTGETSIGNPAKYFTFLIKKRKPRRSLQIPLVSISKSKRTI